MKRVLSRLATRIVFRHPPPPINEKEEILRRKEDIMRYVEVAKARSRARIEGRERSEEKP